MLARAENANAQEVLQVLSTLSLRLCQSAYVDQRYMWQSNSTEPPRRMKHLSTSEDNGVFAMTENMRPILAG